MQFYCILLLSGVFGGYPPATYTRVVDLLTQDGGLGEKYLHKTGVLLTQDGGIADSEKTLIYPLNKGQNGVFRSKICRRTKTYYLKIILKLLTNERFNFLFKKNGYELY